MWIFGKKANQQSTTEVPPELQQYYGRPTLGDRLRQASLFVLPLLAFLVIIGGVIWGASWLRHKPNSPAKPQQQTSQAPSSQNNQSSQPPSSDQQNGSQSQGGASGSDQTASNSQSPAQTGTPTTIPATGPSGMTFAIAGVATVIGAAAFHLRQVRRLRSNI